jgi:hypothetical protein
MGSSALEIIFVPVLWGTFRGIVAGIAMLAVMNAVEALVDRLGSRGRSIEAVHRATPRRAATNSLSVRTGRPRGAYG